MSRPICWLLGHRWASYNVSFVGRYGQPEVWMNDRCLRCSEARNPLIDYEQSAGMIRYGGTVSGDWIAARGPTGRRDR